MAIALSGSLILSGSITVSGSIISTGTISMSGSIASASYASNADTLDGLDSTVFTLTSSFTAQTASFTAFTSSVNSFTASINSFSASVNSYTASQNITNGTFTLTSSFAAQTASFTAFTASVNSFTASQLVLNGTYATTGSNTFKNPQTINSNLTVTGSITAQTLVVQTITSSVDFVTGSTRFGSILGNTHVFSGSVTMNPNGLFVSSSGNVGIGTTNPATYSGYTTLAINNATNGAVLDFLSNGTRVASINNGGASFDIETKTATPIVFGTNNTERMRLDISGNLGLGVTPSAWSGFKAIQVNNASLSGWSSDNTAMFLGANNYFDGTNFRYISSNFANQYRQQAGDHYWFNAPSGTAGDAITFTQAMTLLANGNLLLGTTSAQSGTRLQVAGVMDVWSSTNTLLRLNHDGTRGVIETFTGGAYGPTSINANGGNVLIGTTSDSGYKLDVNGTGRFSGTITSTITNALVLSNNTSTTQYAYCSMANSVGNARYGVDNSSGGGLGTGTSANSAVFGNAGNADVDITTNNISRLKIASTGAATFSSSGCFGGGTNGGATFAINNGGAEAKQTFAGFSSNLNLTQCYNNSGAVYVVDEYRAASYSFKIGTTAALTIASTGAATFSSGIGIGGATATTGGIQFPATAVAIADANNLDDYEEGTFTPTIIGSSTAGTATYGAANGLYTKIGRAVTYNLYIDWSSGTGTGNLRVDGLPFTSVNINVYPASAIGETGGVTLGANGIMTARVNPNSTQIFISQYPAGGGSASSVTYDSAGYLVLAGTYYV